jgi:quercetin dioxygenase-like cupin family protein
VCGLSYQQALRRRSDGNERRASTSGGISPAISTLFLVTKGSTTMKKRTVRLMLGALCFSCTIGVIALRYAWATPPIGVVNTLLAGPVSFDAIDVVDTTPHHQVRIRAEGASDVYAIDVQIAPGGQTGWHSHPGPGFVLVKSGVATEYAGDDCSCSPVVHPAGTGFMENVGHVHDVRNEGTDPLELIALFVLPPGDKPRTDEPNPGNCPF